MVSKPKIPPKPPEALPAMRLSPAAGGKTFLTGALAGVQNKAGFQADFKTSPLGLTERASTTKKRSFLGGIG